MFWFDIIIEHRFNYSMNQSRSYTEVKEAIMAEITAAVSGYSGILSVVDNVMMVTVFYVFIKAWKYRRGYLTKDGWGAAYCIHFQIGSLFCLSVCLSVCVCV